jgi:hypothetical protein
MFALVLASDLLHVGIATGYFDGNAGASLDWW